jgi:hypothetical protein
LGGNKGRSQNKHNRQNDEPRLDASWAWCRHACPSPSPSKVKKKVDPSRTTAIMLRVDGSEHEALDCGRLPAEDRHNGTIR